jgi:SAM-dependent methyltransferase
LSHNPDLSEFVSVGDVYEILDMLDSESRRFDIVNLDHVLEHVVDPIGLLQRLRSVVRPEGLLLVDVPNDGTQFHEQLFADGAIGRRWWVSPPEHLSYFNVESFQDLVIETGWELVDLFADFPIDWYLANAHSNYVDDASLGHQAHKARMRLARHIGAQGPMCELNFYRALAGVGLGRSMTGVLKIARRN